MAAPPSPGRLRGGRRYGLLAFIGGGLAVFLLTGFLLTGCPSETSKSTPADLANAPPEASEDVAATWQAEDVARRRGRPELMEQLRQAAAAPRHPGDGGGKAWLESPKPAVAGRPGSWSLVYEAGPHGVADGGAVFLQVSPFWGWSSPQTRSPNAPGFTTVTTDAPGIVLETSTPDQQLLAVTVRDRALRPGERIRMVYGAGSAGAVADRFAELDSRFWIAVDADGDGIRQVLEKSPTVDVAPGPAARLLVFIPSTARPGEEVRLSLAVVDGRGNAGVDLTARSEDGSAALPLRLQLTVLDGDGNGLQGPLPEASEVRSGVSSQGWRAGDVASTWHRRWVVPASGTWRVQGRLQWSGGVLEGESNPLQISERGRRILWADLQNHSAVSDGTGRPEELFAYARDVASLDVFSLTDHDHWGMLFYDEHEALWREAIELTERFNAPGRYVTIVGFEWTHWVHGHRHVLDFAPPYTLLSSLDPRYDTPQGLWQGLAEIGGPAITLAHHSAGGPVATDWNIPPDPRFEPVTEIVSVHGSSEALDSPGVIYQPVPGNFVRNALDRGYGLGFVGSSDGHDGHPGLGHLASGSGGLAAVLSEDLSRQGVYDALMARRVYATNGPRIVLRVTFGGFPMGSTIPLDGDLAPPVDGIPADTLWAQAIAPGALDRLDVIRSGDVMGSLDCHGERTCSVALTVDDLQPNEYLYVRSVQRDGGAAWSSPFFFQTIP